MSNQEAVQERDLVIEGGGIMGLMTAYYASETDARITLLERSSLPNPESASWSFTRSMHIDYLDRQYTQLAVEARKLWSGIQNEAGTELYVPCSVVNLAKTSVTPDIAQTYGALSYEVSRSLGLPVEMLTKAQLKDEFPQFDSDVAYLERGGGYFKQQEIGHWLLGTLRERGVELLAEVDTTNMFELDGKVTVETNKGNYKADNVVITAGAGTNDLLNKINGNNLQLPIKYVKPDDRRYYYPEESQLDKFMPDRFPVFAYLDGGFYGHPIFDRERGAVKISYWRPPDFVPATGAKFDSIDDFVRECLPDLNGVRSETVQDADFCAYDYVEDDDFIIGRLPNYQQIFVGTGWRGTGYKFGPLVGKALAQLSQRQAVDYDISKFNLERFVS